MSDYFKNYMDKNFKKFHSEIGKTFWQKDAKSDRIFSVEVSGNREYSYISPHEYSKNNKNKDLEFSYIINEHGFRSDQFNKEKAIESYLYAGCSVTFGFGVPIELSWPHQLNKELGQDNLFNLGLIGGSSHRIIVNVLNYIRMYGPPKGIFILFPDLTRVDLFVGNAMVTMNTEKQYKTSKKSVPPEAAPQKLEDAKRFLTYEKLFYDFSFSMLMLETICKSMGIDLLWSTWDNQLNQHILNNGPSGFDGYFDILNEDSVESVIRENYSEFKLYSKMPYYDVARDNEHFGIREHTIYSKMFLNKLKSVIQQ